MAGCSGSLTARASVRRAALLARRDGARLHLVSAFDPQTTLERRRAQRDAPTDVQDRMSPRGEAEEVLAAGAEAIADLGVVVVRHAVAGPCAGALRTVARAIDADLIVVGSQGGALNPGRQLRLWSPCAVEVFDTRPWSDDAKTRPEPASLRV